MCWNLPVIRCNIKKRDLRKNMTWHRGRRGNILTLLTFSFYKNITFQDKSKNMEWRSGLRDWQTLVQEMNNPPESRRLLLVVQNHSCPVENRDWKYSLFSWLACPIFINEKKNGFSQPALPWNGRHIGLLAPSGALIAIPTYYWPTTTTTPLFQI